MIIKIVLLFLIFIAVLAMFGRLRWPGGAEGARTCPRCGGRTRFSGHCPACDGEGR